MVNATLEAIPWREDRVVKQVVKVVKSQNAQELTASSHVEKSKGFRSIIFPSHGHGGLIVPI